MSAPQSSSSGTEPAIWKAISASIKERMDNCDGFWRSCSGCYEMEDGQNVHGYPHSNVFGCILGGGCSECGGIGAIWDTTDYGAMADDILAADARGIPDVAQPFGKPSGWPASLPPEREVRKLIDDFIAPDLDTEKAFATHRRSWLVQCLQALLTAYSVPSTDGEGGK